MLGTMRLPRLPRFKTVEAARESLGRIAEKAKVPRYLNKVVPREGTSHAGVTHVCKRIWAQHDRLFPRTCRYCMHFDFKRGQDSLHGRLADGEADMLNVTAQRHLIDDFQWDVDGKPADLDTRLLGACDVHEAYVLRTGVCVHFERVAGGALVAPEDRVETTPEQVTGWRPAVDPTDTAVAVPDPVSYEPHVVRDGHKGVEDVAKDRG